VSLSFVCQTTGPIACPATTLSRIYRTIPGWDTISNPSDGVIGQDQENRVAFEQRRQQSVAQNSVGTIPAVYGAVSSVPNVLDAFVTDNSTGAPVTLDGVSLPAHSLYVCVSGGDPNAVALAIWSKKMPGCAYAGGTTVAVQDQSSGYQPPFPTYNVSFQTAAPLTLIVSVVMVNSRLVPSDAASQIQAAILNAFVGGDGGPRARIGSTIFASRFYAPVATLGAWAQIISITLGSSGSPAATFTGSISAGTLTVSAVASGTLAVGQVVEGITAHRRLVGTSIAAVSEEASGILSGDAVERGSKCLLQRLDGARGDPAQIGFHLGPTRFDRAQVRAVAGQVAIGKA